MIINALIGLSLLQKFNDINVKTTIMVNDVERNCGMLYAGKCYDACLGRNCPYFDLIKAY
jgi:hypothetical protein